MVVVVIVLPYMFTVAAPILPLGPADWLLRLTPASAFAVQQTLVQYPQVTNTYTAAYGYYPLPPWAGLAVLCAWAALALGLAVLPAAPEGRMRRASTLEARRADPRHTYAGHALHAEWTKARTAGGAAWLLLAAIVATVAVGGVVAAATRCPAVGCGQDPAKASFTGIELGLLYCSR